MSQHLITTKAAINPCQRCGRLLLVGIAEGIQARVELSPVDETAARDAGHTTYTVAGGELVERDDFRRQSPATPILANHRCPNAPTRQGALW